MLLGGCGFFSGSMQITLRLTMIGFVSRRRPCCVTFGIVRRVRNGRLFETAMNIWGVEGPGSQVRIAGAADVIFAPVCIDDLNSIGTAGDGVASGSLESE